ncbi:contractile injection system protein, VgrG/Pvc8 family [Paenibacillus macerans]|uniref:contractile injection system protein, VgrG/Pvc8 family n=1 Tax=Paenibacillus macerans TaxID=44252 RepID=UPI002DB9386B|nr:contractile injection system protein, VgrG/Pvc8 family [Paenibacillus macerans]MEC0330035.1 contractile injection system protein, VgrG/Pvc8 family [Paenibacillus macerans]
MSSSSIVAYNTLKIAPFEIRLHEVKLTKTIDDHARLTFTGIIPEEKEDQYVKMAGEQTDVELQYTDENGKNKTLFHGMLLKLFVRVDREVYWLEAEAVSHTYAMDIKLENRAFQNKSLLIEDVMKEVGGAYAKADFNNTYTEKRKLGAFTLQYQETDWQFLKRLASHYHAPLVPVATYDHIAVYLGIPEHRDAGPIQATHYKVYKDLLAYKNAGASGESGLHESDFICYEVVLDLVLELGDMVTFNKQKLHVFEVHTEMTRGVLTHKYVLCRKKAGYKRKMYNSKIIGASIQGNVMAVVRDEVKVKLDCDQGWSMDTAWLFPYSTMYASEDQTGWYAMPEKGDDVRIYFPGSNEAEGIALSSVRKKLPAEAMGGGNGGSASSGGKIGSGSGNVTTTVVKQETLQPIVHYDNDLKKLKDDLMADPDTKFLLTPTGQKIMFEKDKITIVGAENGASITLTNAGSIILNSVDKITLQTGKRIEMTGESIMMIGDQIEMSTKEDKGGIKIDQGQVVISGVEVLME